MLRLSRALGTAVSLVLAFPLLSASAQEIDGGTQAKLEKILAGTHRSEKNKARDVHRHPAETLAFFGLRDDMSVVEIWPGGGWYTEILAPLLKDRGQYYAAILDRDAGSDYSRKSNAAYEEKLAANPDLYGKVALTEFGPNDTRIGPEGGADMVLTFRNVHNWMAQGWAEQAFKTMFDALKPGGTLGVVEHRATNDKPQDPKAGDGYIRQDHVIELARKAGFVFVAESEVNANPKDTKDHPHGVWTLPPTLGLKDQDRAKYEAIGESDRMTLKFVKPRT